MKYLVIVCIFLFSCARVPVQSVELSQALQDEGERMHLLNLTLIGKIFQEKKYLINEFISKEYAPAIAHNFKQRLDPGTDMFADFEEMIKALYPRINDRRDSLVNALNENKIVIVRKLNEDFKAFTDAFKRLEGLLRSASGIERKRTEVYEQIKKLSGNKINIEAIDKALNQFIRGAGNVGEKAVWLNNTIEELINH